MSESNLINEPIDDAQVVIENFKPLDTIKVALFQFVLTCSLEILSVVLLFTRDHTQNTCGQIIVLLFSQSALWAIYFFLNEYFKYRHNILRLRGHVYIYQKLNKLSAMLFHVASAGSAVILYVLGILLQLKSEKICESVDYFSPTCIIFTIFSLEVIILIPFFVNYMFSVNSFNKLRPMSDVERYECWLPSDEQSSSDFAFRIDCETVTDYLEKQADLIHYYKIANNDLTKKLNEIKKSIRSFNSPACDIHTN